MKIPVATNNNNKQEKLLIFILATINCVWLAKSEDVKPTVSTPEDSTTSAIEGYGTDLQCYLNTCLLPGQTVSWYKNGKLLSNGTQFVDNNDRISLKHSIELEQTCTKSCTGPQQTCSPNEWCRFEDSKCCKCAKEEFTLVIANLTLNDSGKYSCSLQNGNSVDVRLVILDGGSYPSFTDNITFDYYACCQQKQMSNECLKMCKPGAVETRKFDPVPCQKEFSKLLQCSTNEGNISHIHCCRLNGVPAFCWDYCAPRLSSDFSRSNRLCSYWMSEIFQCYEHAYLPFPGQPETLRVSASNDSALEACWDVPSVRGETVQFYSVRYQEVPMFSFLGGGLPFMSLPRPQSGEQNSSPESSGDDDPSTKKSKRQTMVITTHNFATNQTEVREYKYSTINTTETCAIITDLKPSTQYFVYVTATNDYGTSLPSLRETAVTLSISYSNESMPDVYSCCTKNGVEETCAAKMCDVRHPPSSMNAFDLAFTCRKHFPSVSPCLADGRDHTECCRESGVVGDCLKFCDGTAEHAGMSSILCLSLDIQSIFRCFRRGYLSIPSPPTNVTSSDMGQSSAVITWDQPVVNADKVSNYSLFYGSTEYIEIQDVESPYLILGLKPDTSYNVYLIARGETGSSLKSTILTLTTTEPDYDKVCQYGKPLLDAFGQPLKCGSRIRCPASHKCIDGNTDDPETKYCCPIGTSPVGPTMRVEEPNVTMCCASRGVTQDCLHLCNYKTTADDLIDGGWKCAVHLKTFVDCGGDGRNDRPCCEKAGITTPACLDFCAPPLRHALIDYVPCIRDADKIINCGLEGALYLPGPATNMSIEDKGATWATVRWAKPVQTVPVQKYEILFNNVSMANATGYSITVNNLKPGEKYNISIVSWNERGSSLPTYPITVELISAPLSESDYKPRPPNTIRKVDYKDGNANITWEWRNVSVNGRPITSFEFRVFYVSHPSGFAGDGVWKNVTAKDFYAILPNLETNKSYDVRIMAVNLEKNIEGLYSEINIIKATDIDQTASIEMWSDPNGYIREGDMVMVHCVAKGTILTKQIELKQGNAILAKGFGSVNYTFNKIQPENGFNPIFCTVNNGGQIIQKKETLKIRHSPVVTLVNQQLTADQDAAVYMSCKIRGFPRPNVQWIFQSSATSGYNQTVTDDNNRLIELKNGEEENTFEYSLKIESAQAADAGLYTCKACNELGCAYGPVKLAVHASLAPNDPLVSMADCCKAQNVRSDCMSLCVDNPDKDEIDYAEQCYSELSKFFVCSKDGIDYTHCCKQRFVPSRCWYFCNGQVSGISAEQSSIESCSSFRTEILACLSSGQRARPITPEINSVAAVNDKMVNVTWLRSEADPDATYILYYKAQKDQNYTRLRTRNNYALIRGLEPAEHYSFSLMAENHVGRSYASPLRDFVFAESSGVKTSSAGVVIGVILILLIIAVGILSFVYFSRRPQKMPSFLLKWGGRQQPGSTTGPVAFENPGYDREGQVRGLPGDDEPRLTDHHTGWEHAQLENPVSTNNEEQQGMAYSKLF